MAPSGFLKKFLNVFKDEDGNGNWVSLREFMNHLKNHLDGDARKNFKTHNVSRVFKKDEIKLINGEESITLSSLIAYIYSTRSKWTFCQSMCDAIETKLGYKTIDSNLLGFYKEISNFEFHKPRMYEHMYESIDMKKLNTETLNDTYEPNFSVEQWNNICLFEHFFAKQNTFLCLTPEQQIEKRKDYFATLRSTRDIANKINTLATSDIKERQYRSELDMRKEGGDAKSSKLELESFNARGILHSPFCIEEGVRKSIVSVDPDFEGSVHCIDCTQDCQGHDPNGSVHIYIQFANRELPGDVLLFDKISGMISRKILRLHSIVCASVIFYKSIGANPIGRDQFCAHIMRGEIDSFYQWINADKDVPPVSKEGKCELCYAVHDSKPLNCTNFSLEEEWYAAVPLNLQILLESFINYKWCNQAKLHQDLTVFMRKKIMNLYGAYEKLLSCLNPKSIGVIRNMTPSYKAIDKEAHLEGASGQVSKKKYMLTLSPRKDFKRQRLKKKGRTAPKARKPQTSALGKMCGINNAHQVTAHEGRPKPLNSGMCLQIPSRPINLSHHISSNVHQNHTHDSSAAVLAQPQHNSHINSACQLTSSAPLHFPHPRPINVMPSPSLELWQCPVMPVDGIYPTNMWQRPPGPQLNISENVDHGGFSTGHAPSWHQPHHGT